MSEQFTKGAWSAQSIGELSFNVCVLSKGVSVYSSAKAVNDAKFDAALIAAAPEMYEMLKQLSQLIDNDGGAAIDWLIENTFDIRELLAKARGES